MTHVVATAHFFQKAEIRLHRDATCLVPAEQYYYNTFKKDVIKRIKKNIIRPIAGNKPNTYKALFQQIIYVYAKNLGIYTLITTYKKESNNFRK